MTIKSVDEISKNPQLYNNSEICEDVGGICANQ